MAKLRKKGQSGAKKTFISRDKAIKRLQLNLKDFRRLCILKGVHPVEPKHPGRITKSSKKKTYYLANDIRYLSNEPIIWKFWQFKAYIRKIIKFKGRDEHDRLNSLAKNKPFIKLDHVLRQRYPKFIDALRDVDDSLCMCFLYASLTKNDNLPEHVISYSRRLTLEFQHYVIESRSLRKVFVSIKGIYYQVCIMGQTVTFIVPHKLSFPERTDVDYSVMRTFTEFYITLLGFVNYKLFTSINMHYPPKVVMPKKETNVSHVDGAQFVDRAWEHIASLNRPLLKTHIDPTVKEDEQLEFFEDDLGYHQLMKFQKLFEGKKFFLNREVPRESLTFVIRAFGGELSWDSSVALDSTFDETNETIDYQIVDREKVNKKYLNRNYIQPQWVYDSINARRLLPVEDYFPGVKLPPHLSPFVEEKEGTYVPPELDALKTTGSLRVPNESVNSDEEISEEEDEEEEQEEEEKEEDEEQEDEPEPESAKPLKKMQVKRGEVIKENKREAQLKQAQEERKMAEMMIPGKKKRLYNKIIRSQKFQKAEVDKLKRKRAAIDASKTKKTTKAK